MPDLITPFYAQKAKGIKAFPCHTNRASSLGGMCERQRVYDRTAWEQAALPDVDLQLIFDEGNIHEGEVLRTLQEAGVQVVEQQRPLEWREHNITGHVDAVVVVDGKGYPVDVKSMSSHIWDSIFFRGKGVYEWSEVGAKFSTKPWLRKYLGQVVIYCLLKEVEAGMLICKNKGTGALAQVNIPLDYGYAESLIQRADRIEAHVKAGTLPDRIPWDEDECSKCPYLALCLPDRVGKDPLMFVEDAQLAVLLNQRAAVEEQGREFERIDKRVKDIVKAKPFSKMSVGDWLIVKGGNPSRVTVKIERVA